MPAGVGTRAAGARPTTGRCPTGRSVEGPPRPAPIATILVRRSIGPLRPTRALWSIRPRRARTIGWRPSGSRAIPAGPFVRPSAAAGLVGPVDRSRPTARVGRSRTIPPAALRSRPGRSRSPRSAGMRPARWSRPWTARPSRTSRAGARSLAARWSPSIPRRPTGALGSSLRCGAILAPSALPAVAVAVAGSVSHGTLPRGGATAGRRACPRR